MKPRFFIRKNSPEIRRHLETLGYEYLGQESLFKEYNTCLYCTHDGYYEVTKKPSRYDRIYDCGEDVEMFIAMCSRSEKTDKGQFFVLDCNLSSMGNVYLKGTFVMCDRDSWDIDFRYPEFSSRNVPAHKASYDEIVEFFNRNKDMEL